MLMNTFEVNAVCQTFRLECSRVKYKIRWMMSLQAHYRLP